MRLNISLLFLFASLFCRSQNVVTYAGNSGREVFYDVTQLSDGTFLVCGYSENLDWINANVPRIELTFTGNIPNSLGTNKVGFICHFNEDLTQLLRVVHFPQGVVEDVRFMKFTNLPYQATEELFISCNTADTYNNDGGYIIAKLNGNFVNQIPSSLVWHKIVWALSYAKEAHPWDVTAGGEVYYVSGEAHGSNWSAMYCLDSNGNRRAVENWRTHWLTNGTEWKGTPASANPLGDVSNVNYSGIVFKATGRCELRSWNLADYNSTTSDGNGGTKKGKWPADFLFNSPCDITAPSTSGPGYNGYQMESCCPVWGASSLAIDRRNGHVYLGMNFKSFAVDAQSPDFEPAVIAFDATGDLRWWSRLYHEITPSNDTVVSIPDQYVDALAIDYNSDKLVVAARAHGNNVENLWEGNSINSDPSAFGFQNQFTGTNGNIHESWLGKLKLSDGTLTNSTYVAEYAEAATNFGAPHPDPNLDGWPNPNDGWPNVNTTRITKNNLKVSSNGDVIIGGVGRRTITTANAYQKMVLPFYGGLSSWNSFVRQYDDKLQLPKYSSLIVGEWDTLTQAGGGNTDIYGVFKTKDGIVAVGRHTCDQTTLVANGNDIPVTNVPAWGVSASSSESAILVYYRASNIYNENDGFSSAVSELNDMKLEIYPNPAQDFIQIRTNMKGAFEITNVMGQTVMDGSALQPVLQLDMSQLPSGCFIFNLNGVSEKFIVQH